MGESVVQFKRLGGAMPVMSSLIRVVRCDAQAYVQFDSYMATVPMFVIRIGGGMSGCREYAQASQPPMVNVEYV